MVLDVDVFVFDRFTGAFVHRDKAPGGAHYRCGDRGTDSGSKALCKIMRPKDKHKDLLH